MEIAAPKEDREYVSAKELADEAALALISPSTAPFVVRILDLLGQRVFPIGEAHVKAIQEGREAPPGSRVAVYVEIAFEDGLSLVKAIEFPVGRMRCSPENFGGLGFHEILEALSTGWTAVPEFGQLPRAIESLQLNPFVEGE